MANINEVAKLAGVSVATVSRVLNNNYMVSDEKKQKVLEAVKELDYQPNTYAKNLRQSENKMILVVCTIMMEQALDGIKDAAQQAGYDVIFDYLGFRDPKSNALKFLQSGLVGGVIFLNVFHYDDELARVMKEYPNVMCGEFISKSNSTSVSIDDEKAAYEMTDYLIKQNKKRIAFIGLSDDFKFAVDRERGYKRALFDNEYQLDNKLILKGEYSFETGVEAAKKLVELENKPDAIFCAQDMIAAGVIEHLKENNINVPNDIIVAGFDNHEISEMIRPKITTVAQPFYEMGKESAKALISLIKDEDTIGKRIYLNHELFIRESTII
ncbi:MAG: LacI family DNA-binding transcriptional regulator [Fusobacteriaceae bacterium]|nr:LacI family DNA-binding transcriptional regulator [Fusobacteriaceae bacterium]